MEVIQVDLHKDYAGAVERAVFILQEGGVIVHPTDTLYGLGANALDARAAKKIFMIKERPLTMPLPVLVRDMRWAHELADISPRNEEILKKLWPGKFTAILPRKKIVPDIITSGSETVGLRIADYPLMDALLAKLGYPLTMTSANMSGEESSQDIDEVIAVFSGAKRRPDLVIDVGTLPPSSPSTLLDLTTDKPKILRIGAAKPDELMKLLEFAQNHGL
jgi:L-threonylcarbamoyladenylate synthase